MKRTKWTQEQLQKLHEIYPDCFRVEDITGIIGRPLKSIYHKAAQLKLKRNSNVGNTYLKIVGIDSRFKKGNQPWNKGIKGICIGGKETQFKKGNVPHNTRYDGATRLNVDGYIEERISKRNWDLQHRLVWQRQNGPIPEGCLVKFRDGNRLNTNIENLYLSTKKDNMNSNTIHRYPKEIKKAIRLLNKLNKEVNK